MSDMEIKVYLEEADVRKDFFDCKENNLKCPVCGEKIEHIEDGWCNCKNRCLGSGSISLWQELIRTRKALDKGMEHINGLNNMIESWYKLLQSDKDASTKYAILKSAISAYVENKGGDNAETNI